MIKKKNFLGYGFLDEVAKVTFRSSGFKKASTDEWKDILLPNFKNCSPQRKDSSFWLQAFFWLATLILFFFVFLRLFHLQITTGKQNRELADGNRIKIKVIHAPRGVIFDRNGKVLAANAPAFRLFDKQQNNFRLISRGEALELEVKKNTADFDLEVDNVRTYPMGERTAHLVGYVGEISLQQLKDPEYANYKQGDRIGQSGVEAYYEKNLRGIDGGEIIEVDSQNRKVRTLRINSAISGQNIYLNIDGDLQQKLFDQINDALTKTGSCCGVAVAIDPQNGQVIALVSFPTFDPNVFTRGIDDNAIAEIFTRKDSPILNRVIGGNYPPGSTFKIVTSFAGLSSSQITPQTTFIDNGVMHLGIYEFTNWYYNQYGKTEGAVNLVKALKRSNDTYFYEVGRKIGEKTLADWAKKLNIGKTLGVDLPGEISGLVPDNDWKQKTFNEGWYPGDTLHMAIGQGFVLTTPLQVLGITSVVASGGTLYKPQLINKIMAGDNVLMEFKPQTIISNLLNPKDIEVVKQGLKEVSKEGGTAWPFFTFPIPTAGKTGTAEFGDPKGRTHAWYTSFAPVDNPKIALTVLIEGGGEGSSVAAPIAKEIYRWYFSPDKNHLIADTYQIATNSARQFGE